LVIYEVILFDKAILDERWRQIIVFIEMFPFIMLKFQKIHNLN